MGCPRPCSTTGKTKGGPTWEATFVLVCKVRFEKHMPRLAKVYPWETWPTLSLEAYMDWRKNGLFGVNNCLHGTPTGHWRIGKPRIITRVGVDYKSPITITVPIKLSITITVVIEKAITTTITIIRLRLQLLVYPCGVIPCQINQFFAKFARPPSDFDEIWHTCR